MKIYYRLGLHVGDRCTLVWAMSCGTAVPLLASTPQGRSFAFCCAQSKCVPNCCANAGNDLHSSLRGKKPIKSCYICQQIFVQTVSSCLSLQTQLPRDTKRRMSSNGPAPLCSGLCLSSLQICERLKSPQRQGFSF